MDYSFNRVISAAFFLFMCTGELLYNSEPFAFEGLLVGSFAIVLIAGVLISWWKENIGGVILIINAILFAIFIYFSDGRNKVITSVLISSPFLISGVLFLIAGRKK